MSDRPDFRRRKAAPARGVGPLLAALMVAVVLAAALAWLTPSSPSVEALIQVDGEVPNPGTYLTTPTVGAALQAAGASVPDGVDPARPVPDGHRLQLVEGRVEVWPPKDPLVVGLPIDLNQAAVHELMAVPGIGPSMAGAIVAHREEHGPYRNVGALTAVSGVGPSAVDRIRPFLVVPGSRPDPEPEPVDLNTANAERLETLPGVGPVMAARIVVDRAENGPYTVVGDLQRVHGIGPALVEGLNGHAVVAGSP